MYQKMGDFNMSIYWDWYNSTFRRRTNTYTKNKKGLQRTLDVHQIIHNFVRSHWTTGKVPAVSLGIFKDALCLKNILTHRFAQSLNARLD